MREKRLVGAGEHGDREGKIKSEVERSILIRSKGLNTKHQTSSHGASITGRGQSDGGVLHKVVVIGVVNALSHADLFSNLVIDHIFERFFHFFLVCTSAPTHTVNGVHHGFLVKGQRLPLIICTDHEVPRDRINQWEGCLNGPIIVRAVWHCDGDVTHDASRNRVLCKGCDANCHV